MPRDSLMDVDEHGAMLDPLTALPAWVKGEKRLSSMLPYVSLVTDRTIRTRGNELMQCIRLEGVNSTTSEDAYLDRIGGLLAGIVGQVGTEFSFYLHKVSKAVDVTLPPIPGDGFAAEVDLRWRAHLARAGLRDKTITISVLKRPEAGSRIPFGLGASKARLIADTTRRMRKLDEVVAFLLSSFDELKPRLLSDRRTSGVPGQSQHWRGAPAPSALAPWRDRRRRGQHPRHVPRDHNPSVRRRGWGKVRRDLCGEELPRQDRQPDA